LDRYGDNFSDAVLAAVPRIVDLLLLTTGAGLKLRLLAAESLRQDERPERDLSAFCSWRQVYSQAACLQ